MREHANILDTLKEIQARDGFLSDEAIRETAREYGKYPSEVYETATFYSMLHVGQKAAHVVEVCGSTCCDAAGAAEIINAVADELGVSLGQVTEDGTWLFRRCECLGRCDTAPNVVIDGKLIANAETEAVLSVIRKAGGQA